MKPHEKMSTQELGLILGSRLFPGGDLHYGYWADGLEVTWANLATAQVAYSEFLMDHIPGGVNSILDVGVGTGVLAEKLTARGYKVDGVSPSAALTHLARERLGEAVTVFPVRFQDLEADRRYDLVIFSESFQYVPPELSLPKAHEVLNPGGHVLIIDFFKTDAPGKRPLGGGHRLSRFYPVLARQPFTVLEDKDITAQTAPTMELVGRLLREYAQPMYDILGSYLQNNHRVIAKTLGWLFRKRLRKIRFKLFSTQLSGESFHHFQSYRLFLLRKD